MNELCIGLIVKAYSANSSLNWIINQILEIDERALFLRARSSEGRALDFLNSSTLVIAYFKGVCLMNELSSHFIGEITEQQVALEFLKLGYLVSKPLVQSSRYDFIVDVNHKLYKIQVKTGTYKEEAFIEFATSTSHTNTKGTLNLTYSEDDVDFFATM